jgi:hypothetical protein
VHSWISKYPSFAAAVFRARGIAKTSLVAVIRKAAPDDWRAAAWILERSWPDEYARIERVEQIGEKADDKSVGVQIYYQTGNNTLARLLNFPNLETDSPKLGREKQRRLLGQTTAEAPAPEKISDGPPPKVVPKHLSGRLRPEWRRNGK